MEVMKDIERVKALNKMLLNARVVAYGAIVDLIKKIGRLDLDVDSGNHVDDFPAEIRIFTDIGLICLSITSVYLSGEDEGKMWKANRGGIWYLYWYDHDDNPSMIKIERREILLLN
jgi:hypothetical protein